MANLLSGFGIDETFTRTDASGTRTLLVDLQGSTLALSDTTGTTQAQYTYEPFGVTTTSGAGSTNASQFTARENDSTGLYFLRARFYNPVTSRFISEDPIGFSGGQANLYGYVVNNPVNAVDRNGTSVNWIHWWETYNAARAVGFPASASASGHGMTGNCNGRKDPPDRCDGWRRTVDQMGRASLLRLHSTAVWFREALGLDVVVADRVELADAYDANRGQFVAERLAGQLAALRQQVIAMKSATVIGITDRDMYMAGYPRWHFVFSYRGDSAVAVVSYARMDPRNFGQPDNEDLLQSRLRKMVAKDIGMLVYGLRTTRDPRSLMYNGILGLEELDLIEEDLSRAGILPMHRP